MFDKEIAQLDAHLARLSVLLEENNALLVEIRERLPEPELWEEKDGTTRLR